MGLTPDLINKCPRLSEQTGSQAGAGHNYQKTGWLTWPIQPLHVPPLKNPGLMTKCFLSLEDTKSGPHSIPTL